jgi:hypothetical protein
MHERDDARLRPEQSRWLRPDFERYLRPDRERYLRPDHARYERPDTAHQVEVPRQQRFSPTAIVRQIEEIREQRALLAEALREKHVRAALRFKFALARAVQLIRKARSPSDFDPRSSNGLRRSHYDPNQPRVPAGHSDGGQWTDAGGGSSGRNDPRVISDTDAEGFQPGARLAQVRRSGPYYVTISGRLLEPTPAQVARIQVEQSLANAAIARVREYEINWRPRPSAYETVSGLIETIRQERNEAEVHLRALARNGIGVGPFAGESIPARGTGCSLRVGERQDLKRFFSETGCSTCGTYEAGTRSQSPIADHQPRLG